MLTISSLSLDFQKLTEDQRTHYCANGRPVFSWILEGSSQDDEQVAFRLKITCETTKFRFRSAEIATAEQHYSYDGPELPAGQELDFELEVVSRKSGKAKAESFFYVADAGKWQAGWITSALELPYDRPLYFRRQFSLRKKIKYATLYACGLGYQKALVNGLPLEDNRYLDPSFTDFSKRCMYVMYPGVENLLAEGEENCLGFEVAPGWRENYCIATANGNGGEIPFRGANCLTAMLHIVYERGGDEWILTDEQWECGTGALVRADIFNGCTYDARLEHREWCTSDFEGYAPAKMYDGPGGRLEPMVLSPVTSVDFLQPLAKWPKGEHTWLFDFGLNIAGVVCLPLPRGLKKGQKVIVRHSEELDAQGNLFRATLRSAEETDIYIASGEEVEGETFVPYFTYHGFRYASVECPEGVMLEEMPQAMTLRNLLDKDTYFRCGDPLVNSLAEACFNTERANIHNLLTDCPQRDERMGWMNDATVRFEAFPYCFEANQIFRKVTHDIMDAQDSEGGISCTAPFIWGFRPADPLCSSFLIAGWQNYLFDGDTTVIAEAYPAYQAWTDCLLKHCDKDGTVNYTYWGDWAGPAYACPSVEDAVSSFTPGLLVSTGFLYYDCKLLAEMAKVLGRKSDARRYEQLKKKVARAILDKWYDPATKKFAGGSQGSQSLMLWLGIFPEKDIPDAMKAMTAELRENSYRFTTGNICTRYLYEMLIKYGYEDDAWNLLTKQDYPSFGYMFQQEATTIWERYEQKKNAGMNSHNHPMHGSVAYVLYAMLAGIRPLEPGCRRVSIKPHFPTRLLSLQSSVETVMGIVSVHWFKRYGALNLCVTVPFGVTAEVEFNGRKTVCTSGFHTFTAPCEEGKDADW